MCQTSCNPISVFADKYVSERADDALQILNFGGQESREACRSYFSHGKWTYQTIGLAPEGDVDISLGDPYEWKEIASQSVDVLILESFFERPEQISSIAKEVFRVLKQGGICYMALPALNSTQEPSANGYPLDSKSLDTLVRRTGFEILKNNVIHTSDEQAKDSGEPKKITFLVKKPRRNVPDDWTLSSQQSESLPPPIYKAYPAPPDIEEDIESGSCWSKQLALVGRNKSVIDFGCAGGYFAKMLLKRGCQVTGVELNPEAAKVAEKYCQKVLVLDIDDVSIADVLKDEKYDVAVFGDVLEHLRDPWRVLREVSSILYPGGCVVASVPNVAHGAIRLSLLKGDFNYTEVGILDNTHLRFFTRKTVEEMFENSGYFIDAIDRTRAEIFAETTLYPKVQREAFSPDVVELVEKDPESETVQFIVRASPLSWENRYALEKQRTEELFKKIEHLGLKLQQADLEIKNAKDKQSAAEYELQSVNSVKAGMEISKFWKLRQKWISFKHWLFH